MQVTITVWKAAKINSSGHWVHTACQFDSLCVTHKRQKPRQSIVFCGVVIVVAAGWALFHLHSETRHLNFNYKHGWNELTRAIS